MLIGYDHLIDISLHSPMFPPLTVRAAVAKAILALMDERVTRLVTSLANVSLVIVVRTLMGSSLKLVEKLI